MTLILGINLTDSVYLAADTRVTRMLGSKVVGVHDNLLKIWGNQYGIFCAVAGDAGLAKHLLNGLQFQSFSRRGIESVREHIESYVYEKADDYWRNKGQTTEATLMFAGSSKHKKAYIETSLVKDLTDAQLNNSEANNELTNPKFILYCNLAIRPEVQYRTNFNRTDLFAVQVSSQKVNIIDSLPGQHLVYGSPGLVKEDIELKEIARLEFANTDNAPGLLTSYINWMRERRKLLGVSSTVVPMQIQPDGTSILVTGTVYNVDINKDGVPVPKEISSLDVDPSNGKFYRLQHGNRNELVPIALYDTDNSDHMIHLVM